ncbi:SLATT domain-containing protein [Archangium lansingense]|uniref:SLATT domain-containing protein n=1 Tax=Archangium lansingense TaxID=2995310 RepID=A0ABT4AQ15_9BACT|nr:SLATT domain-containing protein [Archangium lansinium]MCY1083798.1 SLATT domain-containing protein [Archangium lansinium]
MSTSPPAALPPITALLDVVRDEFGRVAYSHKTHEKMADRLNSRVLWEKRINAALLALTTGNTITVLVTEARWAEITTVVLAGLSLYVTVYGYSRNRDRLVDQHRQAALSLRFLRDKYIHLIADLMAGSISEEQGRRRRDELAQQVNQAYSSAPPTDSPAYGAAQTALKTNEELTFSVQEINVMLPPALRILPPPAAPPPAGAPPPAAPPPPGAPPST